MDGREDRENSGIESNERLWYMLFKILCHSCNLLKIQDMVSESLRLEITLLTVTTIRWCTRSHYNEE